MVGRESLVPFFGGYSFGLFSGGKLGLLFAVSGSVDFGSGIGSSNSEWFIVPA